MSRFLFDPDAGPVTLALRALSLPTLDWSFEPSHVKGGFGVMWDDIVAAFYTLLLFALWRAA